MERPWQVERNLRELYWDEEMSQTEIADYYGCNSKTVGRWMDRHDIDTRDPGEMGKIAGAKHGVEQSSRETPWQDEEAFRQKFIGENLGCETLADEFDCNVETVRKWRDKHGIEPKSVTENGEGPPTVFSGDLQMVGGYEMVKGGSSDRRTVYVHRLVAVAEYGFQEVVDKHIHHVNGVKWDNRHENLEPMSPSDHAKLHAHGKV